MVMSDSGRIVIRVANDVDRSFRADRDQLIGHPGMVITIPWNVFYRGEVALNITAGKLFLRFNLRGDGVPTRRLSIRKNKEVLRLRSQTQEQH